VTNLQKPEDRVRSSLRRGLAAARAGDHSKARRWLRVALETEPDNITALLWLAWLAPSQQESLTLISRVLELDPQNERARAALHWARRRPSASHGDKPSALDLLDVGQPGGEPPPARPELPSRADLLRDAFGSPEAHEKARSGVTAQRARKLIGPLGLLLVIAACVFAIGVALIAWYSPSAVLAWMLPTVTPTVTPVPTLAQNSTASPTTSIVSVPISAHIPNPAPTALPTHTPNPTATPTLTPAPPTATPIPAPVSQPSANGEKWIDIDLTHQQLKAYQGETPVFQTSVSTGLRNTPTVVGEFRIYWKLTATDMAGPGYYLPGVPYTMYFHAGYALHGTYWHSNFGQPMSHGCVNLDTEDAKWLFDWTAPPLPTGATQVRSSGASPGTLVVVHY
jgi:lipoprotein-anchoring transpeptidase ErfK/SrfK